MFLDDMQSGDNRIVDFDLLAGRKVMQITEACDSYFSVDLNKAQFGQFIEELKALHAQMVD